MMRAFDAVILRRKEPPAVIWQARMAACSLRWQLRSKRRSTGTGSSPYCLSRNLCRIRPTIASPKTMCGRQCAEISDEISAVRFSQTIQDINQLSQPPVIAPIEAEGNPRQRQHLVVFTLFRSRSDDLNLFPVDNVGKVF